MGGKFEDARWIDGTWDLAQFKLASGTPGWAAVAFPPSPAAMLGADAIVVAPAAPGPPVSEALLASRAAWALPMLQQIDDGLIDRPAPNVKN